VALWQIKGGWETWSMNQGENENEVREILLSIVRTTECSGLGTICPQESGVRSVEMRRSFV